jgi:peptidoglycan/LPS O-acetylase OafA/YrhL
MSVGQEAVVSKRHPPAAVTEWAGSDKRLLQLDTLRAFAILAVLFEHWSGLRQWVPIGAGTLGVGLFFTLSGFLITGILLEDLGRREASPGTVLRAFYIRRISRLVPAFYGWLLILGLLGVGGIASSWPWHVAYLSNFYMALGGTESVLWSLAVEEQFYLLWPMVLVLTPRRWLIPAAIAMIALAMVFKLTALAFGSWLSFYLLPWQLDVLGAGCLLAIISFRSGKRNRFEWFTLRVQIIFGAVAIFCLSLAMLDWYLHRGGVTRYLFMNPLCAVFFAWLVAMAARGWSGPFGRILDNAALQYIGRISYGIYLVHNWMPDIVEKFFGPLPKYQAAPIVALLTFGLCALSWRFFEQPIIRMGRRLSANLETGRRRVPLTRPAPEPTNPV